MPRKAGFDLERQPSADAFSAAIVRGTKVSTTASTTTADPTVATDATSGHYITGTAADEATAAGQLIRIKITPSQN